APSKRAGPPPQSSSLPIKILCSPKFASVPKAPGAASPVLHGSARDSDIACLASRFWPRPPPCSIAKLVQDVTAFLHRGDAAEPTLDLPPRLEHAAIPVRHFAEKETATPFAAVCHHQVKMAFQEP